MRVATVPVTVTKTHSGLILPGDRVDVVVTYTVAHNMPGQMNSQFGEIKKAKTILQYIEVFATDNIRQSAVPNGESKDVAAKNISLLVNPDQYVLLMLAESKGQLSLALRHRGDDSRAGRKEKRRGPGQRRTSRLARTGADEGCRSPEENRSENRTRQGQTDLDAQSV
jgi:pilus assembly protein CpaB